MHTFRIHKAKFFVIPLILVLALALSSCASGGIGTAPQIKGTQVLKMPEKGTLRIVVFADVQDTQSVSTDLIMCMEKVLDEQKPDLVVFLGDQAEGKNPWIHLGNNEKNVKTLIDKVLAPVVERGINFCVVFGNHDALDTGVEKETQMAYYASFPGCLASDDGDALPGCGTYDLIYADGNGKPLIHLYFVDSGEYAPDGTYACVTEEQSIWYTERARDAQEKNGGESVPAFLFQHIIVPEIYDLLVQTEKGGDAVEGNDVHSGTYWTAPDDGTFSGVMKEGPCPPTASTQFSYWEQEGDIVAAFFGHDHINSYVAHVGEIDLVACPGMSYASYNDASVRGAQVIDIDADGNYETKALRLTDYEEKGFFADARRLAEHPWISLGVCVILALGLIITAVVLTIKRVIKKKTAKEPVSVN